ncbi:CxxxxCH/CxxCH domain-containing protein [Erythrobacter sp. KY5]
MKSRHNRRCHRDGNARARAAPSSPFWVEGETICAV